jgi:hypothetical protein
MNRSMPRSRKTPTALRLSTTCARATAPGSRIAVRLMAVVQASSRRAWPSIAARDTGSSVSPRARSPASSAAPYAGGSGGVASTRVGSGSRGRSTTRLLWFACHPAVRRRSRRRHRVALLAACRSSPIHPVRGRVSPCPSWTALPWRLPQCGCRTVEVAAGLRQRGFPRTLAASDDSWITGSLRPSDPPRGPAAQASAARRR